MNRNDMDRNPVPRKPDDLPSTDQFHPGIYVALAALVLLFVIGAFAFGDAGYADYLLVVVTGFFIVLMGIPYLLWLTWRHNTDGDQASAGSLREWLRGGYETWQGPVTGREAAIQVLLPVAAVAIGITAIGIVLLLVEHQMV